MHTFLFEEGPIALHIFRPNPHEFWMRILPAILLITFSFYAQVMINKRQKAEKAAQEREKEANLILENNPAAIILIDAQSRKIAYANTNAQKMVQAPIDRIIGNACHRFLCPAEEGNCPVLDLGQEIDISERPLLTSQGKEIAVLKSVTRVRYQGKEHLLESFFDISKQHAMEKAIRQAHAEMDQIFQTASVGMRVIDQDFNILKTNKAFAKLSGIDSAKAVGHKCYDVFEGDMCHTVDCPLKTILDGKELAEYEVNKIRSDGSPLNCILTATRFESAGGETVGIVESFKDVTERNASLAVAIQSEHLAAIGEMAAGVAHEINNPINGIINYAQIVVNKTADNAFLNKVSRGIIKEGDRIAGIVRTLLAFARRDNQKIEQVLVQDIIEDSLTLTRAQLRKDGIHLSIDMDEKLLPVPAKAQEIQQVFVNIINNSRYALNEKFSATDFSSKSFNVENYCAEQALKRLEIHAGWVEDNGSSRVVTRFTDWGTGIKPELMEQITHPFFSTKPTGKGTGLGLSISRRIIEDHGGKFAIESTFGEFTRVTIELPAQQPTE